VRAEPATRTGLPRVLEVSLMRCLEMHQDVSDKVKQASPSLPWVLLLLMGAVSARELFAFAFILHYVAHCVSVL
jgi:hypothetical protein